MACGTTVAKYLVFLFNLLFFIAGVTLIVVGSLALTHKNDFKNVIQDAANYSAIPILFIVIGCVVAVIAFFGCCGAIQENVCMLNTFAIFLILIILAEVAIAIAALVFRGQLSDAVKKEMNNTLSEYDPANKTENVMNITKGWDDLQTSFKCCGIDKPEDWAVNKNFKLENLPISCCSDNMTVPATTCSRQSGTLHKIGCFDDVQKAINVMYVALGVIGLVVGFIEILGVVLACCLSKAVK